MTIKNKNRKKLPFVKDYIINFSKIEFKAKDTKQKYTFELKKQFNNQLYRFSVRSNSCYFHYYCKTSRIHLIVRLSDHSQLHQYNDNFVLKENKELYIQITLYFWNLKDLKNKNKKIESELIRKILIQLTNLRTLLNFRKKEIDNIYKGYENRIGNLITFLKQSDKVEINTSNTKLKGIDLKKNKNITFSAIELLLNVEDEKNSF